MSAERPHLRTLTRRELFGLGGAALAACGLGMVVYRRVSRPRVGDPIARDGLLSPSAFVALDREGLATIWVPKSEMGQGVRTGLAMIVAEELDVPFDRVRVEQAPIDPRFGEMATMASASVRSTHEPLRRAGATLRHVLLLAAAGDLGVGIERLDTEPGAVILRDGSRSIAFGDLVERAMTLDPPSEPIFREGPRRLIGVGVPRVDVLDKVRGAARFGIDVRIAGLRFVVLARAPTGCRTERVDEVAARAIAGVVEVLELPALGSWAVIATTTWAALRGRDALAPTYSPSAHAGLDDTAIAQRLREAADRREHAALDLSNGASTAVAEGETEVDLALSFPYLAHAAMEPLSCTIDLDRERSTARVWAPTQNPIAHRDEIATILDLPPDDVILEVTYLGGGFGRRAEGDEVREAAHVARAMRTTGPIQLVWSRDDDLRFDTFRDAAFAKVRGVARPDGSPRVLEIAIATPSHDPSTYSEPMVKGVLDPLVGLDVQRVHWTGVRLPIRTGIWRSVAHSYTAFVKEHAIDVLARRASADPIEARRRVIAGQPRLLAVLDLAIAAASAHPLAEGRARGVACHACFHSFVAEVADVSIDEGRIRVHRVVVAADVGTVVHPDLVRQQMEGGVIFGLTAALYGRVPIVDGAPALGSFADYPLLRIGDAPEIETVIVASDEPPTGAGELAVPCIAPAVANAILALRGHAQSGLPLTLA